MSKTIVHYLSSLPGVGKTKMAVQKMRRHLQGTDGIIFYVAPTINLLDEVQGNIVRDLPREQTRKVRMVVSMEDDTLPVNLKISKMLRGFRKNGVTTKLEGGSVVLMTHEGFLKLHDDLPRKDEITVIFDEARKFTAKLKPIKLKNDNERSTFAALVQENSTELLDKDGDSTGFMRFSLQEWPRNLKQMTETSYSRRQYASLRDVVESATNSRTDLYVRESSHENYHFYEVVIPSRVFKGFRTVILMAAFLEDSQMWHLLKNTADVIMLPLHKLEGWESAQTRFVDADHKIMTRFSKLCIFPLTVQESPLSMTRMRRALMVPSKKLNLIREKLEELGINDTKTLIAHKRNASMTEPTTEEAQALELCEANRVKFNAFAWYLKAAEKFIDTLKEEGKVEGDVLLVVNERNARHATNVHPEWTRISSVSHGLNKYSASNTIVFAAAINPEPDLAVLYRALLRGYDFSLDHLADSCVQSVTRMCVRDTNSEVVAYVILPDSAMANLLRHKMLDRPIISMRAADRFQRVALSTLNTNRKRAMRAETNGQRKSRLKNANASYQNNWLSKNEHNKRLSQLRVARSKLKKKIEDSSGRQRSSLEGKLADLQFEIDQTVNMRNAAKESS